MTGTKLDARSIAQAMARRRRGPELTSRRPPGFSVAEAAQITGIAVDRFEELDQGLAPASSTCREDADGWPLYRYGLGDLYRAVVVCDLLEAGVPIVALALEADEMAERVSEIDADGLTRPVRYRWEDAYPLSPDVAERWVRETGRASRNLGEWHLEYIDDMSEDELADLLAENGVARAAIDRGEAILYRLWQTAERLLGRLDAWWAAHPEYERP
ncbi:MAG: hypothetical protein ACHQNA_12850 [Acidimicrobiales bacterium]